MAQVMKYCFNGHRKQSAGYKRGNVAAFIHAGTKRKSSRFKTR